MRELGLKEIYPGGTLYPDRKWTSPELWAMSFFLIVPKKLRAEKKWRKKNNELIAKDTFKKLVATYGKVVGSLGMIVLMCSCASFDVLKDWHEQIEPHIPKKEEPEPEPQPQPEPEPTPTNVVELSDCHWLVNDMTVYFPPRFTFDPNMKIYRQTSDGQNTDQAIKISTIESLGGIRIRALFHKSESYPLKHEIVLFGVGQFGRWRIKNWKLDEPQLEEIK